MYGRKTQKQANKVLISLVKLGILSQEIGTSLKWPFKGLHFHIGLFQHCFLDFLDNKQMHFSQDKSLRGVDCQENINMSHSMHFGQQPVLFFLM